MGTKPSIEKVLEELEETRRETLRILEALTVEEIESHPGDGWSPAQVLDHLFRVELGSVKVVKHLLKNAPPNLPPYPEEEASLLTKKFELPEGAKAPEIVEPAASVSAEETLKNLHEIRESTREVLHRLCEIDPRNLTYPHPFFGELNALEWFAFLSPHERTHQNQLREMVKKIKSQS